jgi:hypothetical protein
VTLLLPLNDGISGVAILTLRVRNDRPFHADFR